MSDPFLRWLSAKARDAADQFQGHLWTEEAPYEKEAQHFDGLAADAKQTVNDAFHCDLLG